MKPPSTVLSGWQSPGCAEKCSLGVQVWAVLPSLGNINRSPWTSQSPAVSQRAAGVRLLLNVPCSWAAARLHVESCGGGKRETRELPDWQVGFAVLFKMLNQSFTWRGGRRGWIMVGRCLQEYSNSPISEAGRQLCLAGAEFLPLQRQLTSLSDVNVLVLVVWPYQREKAPLNKSAAIWRDNEIQHPPRLLSSLNYERFRAQCCPARPPRAASCLDYTYSAA